jgi:hypothetical protein
MRAGVTLLVAAILVNGGCASREPEQVRAQPVPSITVELPSPVPSEAVRSLADRRPVRPVMLPRLPSEGLVVTGGRGVVFLDLEGDVIARLPHLDLAGNTGNPAIWLQEGRNYYRLDVRRHRLQPVWRWVARSRMYEQPGADLPQPPGTRFRGMAVGRWSYEFRSPTSDVRLAQWSGECEVPHAFWIHPDGSMQLLTGEESVRGATESIALGWTPDGRAVALLLGGACGAGAPRPGIYAFTRVGQYELIHPTRGYARAAMWAR